MRGWMDGLTGNSQCADYNMIIQNKTPIYKVPNPNVSVSPLNSINIKYKLSYGALGFNRVYQVSIDLQTYIGFRCSVMQQIHSSHLVQSSAASPKPTLGFKVIQHSIQDLNVGSFLQQRTATNGGRYQHIPGNFSKPSCSIIHFSTALK